MAVTRQTLRELLDQQRTIGRILDDQTRELTARWVKTWDAINAALEAAVTQAIMEGEDAGVSRIVAQVKANSALDIVSRALTTMIDTSAAMSRSGVQ